MSPIRTSLIRNRALRHTILAWLCLSALSVTFTGALFAQIPPAAGTADQAWVAVRTQHQAATATKKTRLVGVVSANPSEAAALKNERVARAQQFRSAAQAAKEFYGRYPQHPQAAEARKLEALAEIEGILPKDKVHERAALATASAYRTNPVFPAADRFAVAHAMESRELQKKVLGRPWFTNPVLAEMMLDRLQREFGEQPFVWSAYLGLARNTYCDAGKDVAHRIVQSPYAPEPTRAAARQILERYALVRQPLDFQLVPQRGPSTTLAQVAGKTTIVCFWDGTRHPEGPPGLHDFKKNPAPNTRWVYVSLGEIGTLPPGKRATSAPPGTVCIEPLGWNSPLATRLRITELPCAFVFDEQKRLSGYGRIDEIPSLIAGIGRPALP